MTKTGNLRALIILGAGNFESRRRAKAGYEIACQGDFPIIVTGYNGESEVMKETLIKQQEPFFLNAINPERIIEDKIAYNTFTNLYRSRDVLHNLGIHNGNLGLLTGKAHLSRTKRFAKLILPNYNLKTFSPKMRTPWDFLTEFITTFFEVFSGPYNSRKLAEFKESGKTLEDFPRVIMPYNVAYLKRADKERAA